MLVLMRRLGQEVTCRKGDITLRVRVTQLHYSMRRYALVSVTRELPREMAQPIASAWLSRNETLQISDIGSVMVIKIKPVGGKVWIGISLPREWRISRPESLSLIHI